MKKSILLSFLALLLPSMALAATYNGTPTPAEDMATKKDDKGCYQISSAEDLYGFAAIVNGDEGYTKNTSACGKLMDNIVVNENVLDADGNLNDAPDGGFKAWTPIGTSFITSFSGSFDGNGHTISGLYFNDDSKVNVGLFGYVDGGSLKDPITINGVGVVDSYIKGKNAVGGLVGYVDDAATVSITNSYSVGSVTGHGDYVGGLVGYAHGTRLSITNSYSGGSVTGHGDYVGGLVGYAHGTKLSITNSYSGGGVSGGKYVGGLVGYAYNGLTVTITNSYSGGGVTGSNYVGGLVGYASSSAIVSITNSYNVGSVTGSGDYVGGLVGGTYGSVSITDCYSVGSVTGSGDYVGGLVGGTYGSVSITNSYSGGGVTGRNYVGGLFGNVSSGATVSITNSYNVGSVTGSNYVGGLVGYASSSAIVSITNSYNVGSVMGGNEVGGLLGSVYEKSAVSIMNSFVMLVSEDDLKQSLTDGKILAEHIVGTANSYDVDAENKNRLRDADDFHNGSIANLLHDWCELNDAGAACKANGANGAVWGQHVGHDVYPVLSNTYDPKGKLLPGEVKIDLDYVLNEGSIATGATGTHTYGTKTVLPVPTRDGYTFVGWYESADFFGDKVESISADAKITVTSQTVGETIVWKKKYYAKWIKIPKLVNKGSDDACYEIADADELYTFAAIVNEDVAASDLPSGYPTGTAICGKLKNNIVVNENVLDADGNLKDAPDGGFKVWTPIGKYSSDGKETFSGSFDGNGHTISGLYYNDASVRYVGLFGRVEGGTEQKPVAITNLGVVDFYFKGSSSVGAFIASSSESVVSIANSYSDGYVSGNNFIGGLMGFAGGVVSITNSLSNVIINGASGREDGAGGLVGCIGINGKVSITNSYSSVSVNGTGQNYVSGLVGLVVGPITITNSHSIVNASVDNYKGGGLITYVGSTLLPTGVVLPITITNSYSIINVEREKNWGDLVFFVSHTSNVAIMNSFVVVNASGGDSDDGLVALDPSENITANIVNFFALKGNNDNQKMVDSSADHTVSIDEASGFKSSDEFANGTVATLLHDWCETYAPDGKTCAEGSADGTVWGQHVGHDVFPVLSSTYDDAGNLLPGVVEFDLDCVLNGGVNAEGAVATYVYGKETVLPVPARAGYAFEGWFESEDFSGSKITTIAKDATGAKKFYAKWSGPIEYTVTYNNVNGATNANPTAYTVETEKVNLSALTRGGYKFLGWFDGEGDDANEVKKIAGGETGNVILYARWSIESYEIKVAVNDSKMGTVSGAGSYEYGAKITLVATAADGYKFSNWEDDATASATRKVTVSKAASYKANFEKVAASSSSAKPASSSSKKASSSSNVKPGSSSSSVIPGSDPESGSSTKPASSSSKKVAASSSSSKPRSSSSVIPGSDPESSSSKKDAIVASAKVPMFSVTVMGRNLQIAGAPVGEKIAILDMQGRVLNAGLAFTGRVDAANFNVAMPRSGSYMVRIGNQVQRVNVK